MAPMKQLTPSGVRTLGTDRRSKTKQKDATYRASLYLLLGFGGPYAEKSAPIYDEFRRWKDLLYVEFQASSLKAIRSK